MNTPKVPVSWGELIDKIIILEIKCARLNDKETLHNAQKELSLLKGEAELTLAQRPELNSLRMRLTVINQSLWDTEDRIRQKEAAQEFDSEFVKIARSVYKLNDERAAIKRMINLQLSSELIEEKSYPLPPIDLDGTGSR